MTRENLEYLSADGKTRIHAVRWVPEGEIRGCLQIAHGMAEYIERYEDFAKFLNEQGIMVTGNDHLGHGRSVEDRADWGYFAEKDGNRTVLSDLKKLKELTEKEYPGLPWFFLGHSMGSFLARQVICERGDEYRGVIVMGTGEQPAAVLSAAKLLCRMIASFKGWKYRSPLVDSMAFGSYNRKFGEKGGTDWLSTVEEHVKKYNDDPACGYMFTLNGYYTMFDSISHLADRRYCEKAPKQLPVLIVSGGDDPVGNFGKDPEAVCEKMKKLGMKDVKLLLYPGLRHEILGEKDREKVFGDLSDWIEEKNR